MNRMCAGATINAISRLAAISGSFMLIGARKSLDYFSPLNETAAVTWCG